MSSTEQRAEVLFEHGASIAITQELLPFNAPAQIRAAKQPSYQMHIPTWERYAAAAQHRQLLDVLRDDLRQLNFPVADGMSQQAHYLSATRQGHAAQSPVLAVEKSAEITLIIHDSIAGAIPILQCAERATFERLVQVFAHRNEPVAIPASMGSCLITGYVNWGRIDQLRTQWVMEKGVSGLREWPHEFRRYVLPNKALYHDSFLILSSGPYSGVAATALGLSEDAWRDRSIRIRREHECVHYFLLQQRGYLHHGVLDELLCDFAALCAIGEGANTADWLRHFYGLEAFPDFRPNGRLTNYRGDLSDPAFDVLLALVNSAIDRLAQLAPHIDPSNLQQAVSQLAMQSLESLCALPLQRGNHV